MNSFVFDFKCMQYPYKKKKSLFSRVLEKFLTDQFQLNAYKMRVTKVNQHSLNKSVTGHVLPCQQRHLTNILETKKAFTVAHYPSRQIH